MYSESVSINLSVRAARKFGLTYFHVRCNIIITTGNLSVSQSIDIRCCARGQCLTSFEWV